MFEEKPIGQFVEPTSEGGEATKRNITPEVIGGDCRDVLKTLSSATVDFSMASIPYWNKRKAHYPGYEPGHLWEWFDPIQRELQRILKRTGVLVINTDRLMLKGSVHPETYALPVLMQAAGWLQVDEYIWHKSIAPRGLFPKRDVHAHEKCFVFALSPDYVFNRIKVPSKQKPEEIARSNERLRYDWAWAETGSGSGFSASYPRSNEVFRTNVFTVANSNGSLHPAAFRPDVPAYFIPAFCPEDGTVLDFCCGSGATLWAAYDLGRPSIGIDIKEEYVAHCRKVIERIRGGEIAVKAAVADRQQVSETNLPQTGNTPTDEEHFWLSGVEAEIRDLFTSKGLSLPPLRTRIGPARKFDCRLPCEWWPPDRASDGVATVVMYSNLDVPTVEWLAFYAHACLHGVYPDDRHDSRRFRAAAAEIGLRHPPSRAEPGAEFREWAEGVIERQGERPFGSLDTVSAKTHTKSGMLRLVCPDCPNVGFPISESDLRRNGEMAHVACGIGYVREDGKPLPWERMAVASPPRKVSVYQRGLAT